MNSNDFMEGIHILQNNYNKKFSNEQLKLFYTNLQDMDKERYLENIKQIIKTSQYMPNIAQLRNESNKNFMNYTQRDYSGLDLSQYYAN